jgi:hypothetical protein
MTEDKKPLSERRAGLVVAALAGIPGGPIGIFASPLVLYLLTFILKSKNGTNPNRFIPWFLVGIVGVPLCLLPFSGSSVGVGERKEDSSTRLGRQRSMPSLSEPASPPVKPDIVQEQETREVPSFDTGNASQIVENKQSPAGRLSVPVPVAPAKNTSVSDNLNAADGLFKAGMDGCDNVSIAIMAANNPDVYGPVSADQVSELKKYAKKCNLRY